MSIFLTCKMLYGPQWRRDLHALPFWERALLVFYAILLGLVMPFICWGAYAQPGHPHARPHLVFMDPVMDMSAAQEARTKPSSATKMDMALDMPMGQPMAAATDGQSPPSHSAPVGRSTPQLLLFALLVLLAGALWQISRIDIHYAILVCIALFAKPLRRNVPTPPPRAAFQLVNAWGCS